MVQLLNTIIIVLFVMFNSSGTISYAKTTTFEKEELRRRTKREAESMQQLQQTPAVMSKNKIKHDKSFNLLTDKVCFKINSIKLAGEKVEFFQWIENELKNYLGKCVGVHSINLIIKRFSEELVTRGYITTRVTIPEQELIGGTLKLVLVPGIIHDIRLENEFWGTWKTAFPNRPGDLLNLRDIEQGLEQMERLPYQKADIQIIPGPDPGESDIIIRLRRVKPWRVSVLMDDSDLKSTSNLQVYFSFSLDNPLGLNDFFSIGVNTDARGCYAKGYLGNNIYYGVPWGYWTFGLSGNWYSYHQTIQGINEEVKYSGESKNFEAMVQRVICRDETKKTSLQFRATKTYTKSYLNDFELEIQHRDTVHTESAIVHRHYIGATQLDIVLAYRQGVRWGNSQQDPTTSASDQPTNFFKMGTIDATLFLPFKIKDCQVKYIGRFRGQYTVNRLFTADMFSIGNRYTVRGFGDEEAIAGEHGYFIRNELETPVWETRLVAYCGIDHGVVRGPGTEYLLDTNLTGAAIGVRGSWQHFSYDLTLSYPLDNPRWLKASPPFIFGMLTAHF